MNYLSMAPLLAQMRMAALYQQQPQQQMPEPMQVGPINPILLGNMGVPVTPAVQPPEMPAEPDPYQTIMDRYQPHTAANDLYTSALSQAPQRNQPGMGRRLLASLASGAAGFIGRPDAQQFGEDVAYPGYNRKVVDYNNRLKQLSAGASEEDKYNTNQRLLANNDLTAYVNQQKLAEAEKKSNQIYETKNREMQLRHEIDQQKVEIARQVAMGGQIVSDEKGVHGPAGMLYMVYKDGTSKPLDMGKFTPEDVAEIKSKFDIKSIDERGAQARSTKATPSGTIQPKAIFDEQGNQIGFAAYNPVTKKMEVLDSSQLPTGSTTTAPNVGSTTTTVVKDKDGNVVGTRTNETIKNVKYGKGTEEKFVDVKGQDISDKAEAFIKDALANKLVKTRSEAIAILRARGIIK